MRGWMLILTEGERERERWRERRWNDEEETNSEILFDDIQTLE